MKEVELPDGVVAEFPDDMPDEQIAAVLREQFPAKKTKRAGPLRQAEAALRGVTTGLLGAGDLAAAAGDVVGGQIIRPLVGKEPLDISKTFERVRGERKALEAEAPVASGVGVVAGALSPVATAGRLAQSVGLGLKLGQPAANVAKTAAAGAAQGGVTAAALGEDVGEGAALGAGGATVAGGLVRGAGALVNLGRSALDKNKNEGFHVLARELQKRGAAITPEILRARADSFKAATGRAPAIVDLLREEGPELVATLTRRGKEASRTLSAAAARRATELQQDLAKGIAGGRKLISTTKLDELRKIANDRAMAKIKDRKVFFNEDAVKAITESPEARKALPEVERGLLLDIEDSGGVLTIRQVEDIRQALAKRSKGAGGPAKRMRDFVDALVEGAGEQVPEFRRFLASATRRRAAVKGAEQGARVGKEDPAEFADKVAAMAKPALGGARARARTKLASDAAKSPTSAASMARALSEDAGLARSLSALDPKEAARLQRLGEEQTKSLRGVARLGALAQRNLTRDADAEAARGAVETLLSATGAGSLSFKLSALRRFLMSSKVPPTAAKRLAEDLVDPTKTEEALRRLDALGVAPRRVEEFARAASRGGARSVAADGSDE